VKARREEAEKLLFEARQTAGLDDQRLTLAERWDTMTVPERRRALQAFEVVAYVERGRQPADERVTIELRGSPVANGWEPDVEYTLPSDEELAERITAEFAAAGIVITNVAERIAAWKAKHADAKIVIKPIVLSEEDKATEEAIFGPLERALRKRARQQAKRQPKSHRLTRQHAFDRAAACRELRELRRDPCRPTTLEASGRSDVAGKAG